LTSDEMIGELFGLNTVFNYGPIWERMKESGVMGSLITAGIILTFATTCIGMLLNSKVLWSDEGRNRGILEVNIPLFAKTVVLGFLLLFYGTFSEILLNLLSTLSDFLFRGSLQIFRADFHYLIASISGQSDAQTPLFFPSLKASIEVFLFSVSLNLLIILFYVIILFSPAFMIIALVAGPVLIPMGIVSRDILSKWGLFLLAAGLLPAFTGLGIQIINTMDYLPAMAESSLDGKLIQTIFLAVTVVVFTTAIPATVAHLFGARPIAAFTTVLGFMSLCTGMFSTSFNTIIQVFFFRNRKK